MRRYPLMTLAAAVLMSLAGCGSDADANDPTSGPTVAVDIDPCELLTVQEREDLIGVPADDPIQSTDSNCRYGQDQSHALVVTSLDAEEWSRQLPAALDQMLRTDLSDEDRRQMEQASQLLAAEGELSGRKACSVFSVLAELNGAPAGSDAIVNFNEVTLSGEPQFTAAGQVCTKGRFTSVVVTYPELKADDAMAQQTEEAVRSVHSRALAASL